MFSFICAKISLSLTLAGSKLSEISLLVSLIWEAALTAIACLRTFMSRNSLEVLPTPLISNKESISAMYSKGNGRDFYFVAIFTSLKTYLVDYKDITVFSPSYVTWGEARPIKSVNPEKEA
jgi:hypothetical protein